MNTKKLISIFTVCAFVLFFAGKNKKAKEEEKLLSRRIVYDVPVVNPAGNNDVWYRDNLEASRRIAFNKMILDYALSGKIKIYDSLNNIVDANKALSCKKHSQVYRRYPPFDLYDTMIWTKYSPDDIKLIRFDEEWTFNDKTFEITKKINRICPIVAEIEKDSNKFMNYKPLFWIRFDNIPEQEQDKYIKLTERIEYSVPITNSQKKGGKSNNSYSYIIEHSRNTDYTVCVGYIKNLTEGLFNNKIVAFDILPDDISTQALKVKNFINRFESVDSLKTKSPNPPYNDTTIVTRFNRINELYQSQNIRFLEEWKINIDNLKIEKKVIGIEPLMYTEDVFGNFTGFRPAFYVYFNDIWMPLSSKINIGKIINSGNH